MNTEVIYWFYLEPYSFIFEGEFETIIYNTINSAYIRVSNKGILNRVIADLHKVENGYTAALCESDLRDEDVRIFVDNIRNSFSGDLIQYIDEHLRPFIFKPTLRVIDIKLLAESRKKGDKIEFGTEVLQNLNEVSLIFPCTMEVAVLTSEYYFNLLRQLEAFGISKINFMCEELSAIEELHCILSAFFMCDCQKVIYLSFSQFDNSKIRNLYVDDRTSFAVHIHVPYDETLVLNKMNELSDLPVEWNFVVTAESDLVKIEQLQEKVNANISIIPSYNGNNLAFFEEFVFNTLEDIIADPIDKQTIFRRQVLNENFFGKLTILPSGDVYANLNCGVIGNILHHSLAELVYKEMTESTAWFKTRNEGKCKDCVNKYLCPSPSNYELVLQRENLCHVL